MAFDRNAWRRQWGEANPDKVRKQLDRDNAARRNVRQTETPEQREARLTKQRARHKRWRDANPEKLKAYVKQDRAKNMDRIRKQGRARALMVKYGVTLEQYEGMAHSQGYRCAVCGSDKATARHSPYSWRVDHDHKTGAVRALLCHNCNIAIGLLRDSSSIALSMANYLKIHGN